jgi:toxin CcdB
MAQFDVITLRSGGLVLDCQADLLSDLNTRFVVPLSLPHDAPPTRVRLNPTFDINGKTYVMVTQFAAALSVSHLGETVASLGREEFTIKNALDFLLTGV